MMSSTAATPATAAATTEKDLRFVLGLKLKSMRRQRGLTLQQLARQTDLSISYISEIEKGKKYPKAEKLLRLASALGVPFEDLVTELTRGGDDQSGQTQQPGDVHPGTDTDAPRAESGECLTQDRPGQQVAQNGADHAAREGRHGDHHHVHREHLPGRNIADSNADHLRKLLLPAPVRLPDLIGPGVGKRHAKR